MTPVVHLLGRPHIEGRPGGYRIRSRKSWALLAYLLLGERPPTRSQLAALLFDEADDPLAALRWGLAELRRALGPGAVVEGDPVVLRLPPGTVVDARVVLGGSWEEAIALPGLGSELLADHPTRGAAAFESWLLSAQRRVLAASEEILHEAALASLSRDALDDAIAYAVRLVDDDPAGGEPPRPADPALPSGRRRRRGAAPARHLHRDPRARARGRGPGPWCARPCARPAATHAVRRRTSPRSRPRSRPVARRCPPARSRPAPTRCGPRCAAPTAWLEPRLQVRTRLVAGRGAGPRARWARRGGHGGAAGRRRHRPRRRRPRRRWRRRAPSSATSTSCAAATTARGCGSTSPWSTPTAPQLVTAKATTYLGSVESDQGHYESALAHLGRGEPSRPERGRPATGRLRLVDDRTDPPAPPGPRPRGAAPRRVAGTWSSRTTGWRSRRGRSRCGARSSWRVATWTRPPR